MRFTNNLNLPQPLVDAVTNDPYNAGECEISVTGLINSPRRRQLLTQYDDQIEEDVSDRLWALFGQVGHGILERAASGDPETEVVEKRFFAKLDDWVISGQLDLLAYTDPKIPAGVPIKKKLRFLEKGVMSDYKIMSVWEIVYGMKDEKIAQQNMLAWLCQMNGLRVRKLQIVSLLRDWSRTKAMQGGNYPNRNVVVSSVPFWSMEKTEAYIRERIAAHKEAAEILPLCSAEDRWHKDDKFAVFRNENKTATRVLDSEANANLYIEDQKQKEAAKAKPKVVKWRVEKRPGEDIRCMHYCAAAPFCEQWQGILKECKSYSPGWRAARTSILMLWKGRTLPQKILREKLMARWTQSRVVILKLSRMMIMPKTYITFGQEHVHNINGKTFDKDCVAEVNLPEEEARAIFMPKFCFSYTDLDAVNLEYYPRGIISLAVV